MHGISHFLVLAVTPLPSEQLLCLNHEASAVSRLSWQLVAFFPGEAGLATCSFLE